MLLGERIQKQRMAAIDLVFTGDLVLDEPDADYWLSGIASATQAADATIGHLEVHLWAPMELPYDANMNRTFAADPVWGQE